MRTVDTVIKEYGDLLDLAERRVVPRILPAMGDPTDDENMNKAASWGSVFEYFTELAEYDLQRAKSTWRAIAWEYGHGVVYVGWDEQRQMQKKTLTADQVMQLIAMDAVNQGANPQAALNGAAQLVTDKELKSPLVEALQNGYAGVRHWDHYDAEALPYFSAARRILMLGWLQSRSEIPRLRKHLKKTAPKVARFLKSNWKNFS